MKISACMRVKSGLIIDSCYVPEKTFDFDITTNRKKKCHCFVISILCFRDYSKSLFDITKFQKEVKNS